MQPDHVTSRDSNPSGPSSSPAQTGTPPDTEVVGELLSPEEVADYEQLRTLVSPEKSLALLDDFVKWLFVTAAVVGTLGASFGVTQGTDLTGTGKRMFSWAVVLVGVSLALAALARVPHGKRVNRYSDVDLRDYVSRVVRIRVWLLLFAVGFFAAALVLAGLSPLFS